MKSWETVAQKLCGHSMEIQVSDGLSGGWSLTSGVENHNGCYFTKVKSSFKSDLTHIGIFTSSLNVNDEERVCICEINTKC